MKIIDILPKVRGSYRENVTLAKTNWFKVGGLASILFKPLDIEDLAYFIKNKPKYIKYVVIGCGSNLIVRDKGFEGVVIKLGQGFNECSAQGDLIIAGAGMLSYNLAMFACKNQIGGFEFLSGIPGTVGGNLAMNAGAYGEDVASILTQASIIDDKGILYNLKPDDIGYIYRGNNLSKNWVFTQGIFRGFKDKIENIKMKIDDISQKRKASQPIKERTSGSTFKNPSNFKAWELIDQAGCRGLRIGGAVVSDMHCNFLINDQNALARDIEELGQEVKKRVLEKSGIKLEWEIEIIGEK